MKEKNTITDGLLQTVSLVYTSILNLNELLGLLNIKMWYNIKYVFN